MKRRVFVPMDFTISEEFTVELKRAGDKFEVSYSEFFEEGERELAERSSAVVRYFMDPSIELMENTLEGNTWRLRFRAPFRDAINYIFGEVALRRFAYRDELYTWGQEAALIFPERPLTRLVKPAIPPMGDRGAFTC